MRPEVGERSDEGVVKARRERLLVEEVRGELVVYDLERGTVHLLNPVAAFVWRRSDGRRTAAELAALLRGELGLSADEDLVLLALDELESKYLLEETEAAARLSRRQAIRRLAAATAVGLMVPLVESLSPPPAYAAASKPGRCKDHCGTKLMNGEVECEGECEPGGTPCVEFTDKDGKMCCRCRDEVKP